MVGEPKHSKGFTLIELMLATSLLMMVLFSGYYAYSLYTQKWQKRVDTFWQGTQDAIGVDALNRLLMATVPYVVKGSNDRLNTYFAGDKQFIQFVSNYSLFSDDASVIRIEFEPEQQQIIYKEKSLSHFALINTSQVEFVQDETEFLWEHVTVLADEIQNVQFSYNGWLTFDEAMQEMNLGENLRRSDAKPQWYQEHNTEVQRVLPKLVSIELQSKDIQTSFIVTMPDNTEYWLLSNIRKDSE